MKPNTDGSTCAYRRGILTLLVTLATINSGVGVAANAPGGWNVHRSADYGFVIAYPPDFKSYSDLLEAQRSYIPVCQSESIACFEYNGNEYEGTNFEAAGVSVNILRELRTEKECYKIENVSLPDPEDNTQWHSLSLRRYCRRRLGPRNRRPGLPHLSRTRLFCRPAHYYGQQTTLFEPR